MRSRLAAIYVGIIIIKKLSSLPPQVFETLGRDVVSTVRGGVSACVLAYGQSATGKTHTMIGSELQPGLLPRVCRALAEGGDMAVTVRFVVL